MFHVRPKLTIDGQIEYLKSKGITFELRSESEARQYLQSKNNLFRLMAFGKLFPKREGGDQDGQFIDLDFEHLRDLSFLDQSLRSMFLPMALDIEHYEKVKLMALISASQDEDGYSIVSDYRESLPRNKQVIYDSELESRQNDAYCGRIIRKYKEDIPVWALLEVVSCGRFIDFCRFCSLRWDDKALMDEHYMLKKAKSLRNAAAHGSCIISGFADADCKNVSLPHQVQRSISNMGISKRLRRSRLSCTRMKEIATLLYLYHATVPEGLSKQRAIRSFDKFFDDFNASNLYQENSVIFSSIRFIRLLTEGFRLP